MRLPNAPGEPLPPELAGDEVRFPEGLVRLLVEQHTRPGGVVLDPFAGSGTVRAVAEALGREGYGLELDAGRHAYGAARLRSPGRMVHGDARRLATYGFPPADLCLTGVPFCTLDETADPLTWYAAPGRGYAFGG